MPDDSTNGAPSNPPPGRSLATMRIGESARVLSAPADSDQARRLMRMGLCAGRTVQLLRRGNPLIVRIHGARLGLSARLAELVRVESADAADPSTPLGSDPSPNREA